MGTKSKSGSPSWLPSKESKYFLTELRNDEDPVLSIKYTPEAVIKELSNFFSYFYLKEIGIKVPKSFLVRSDSPLVGILTAWHAMGEYLVETGAGNRRRASTEEEIRSDFDTIESGTSDEDVAPGEIMEKLQNVDISRMSYAVGKMTTLATDYIAENLPEKIQSALFELIFESQAYALRTIAEQQNAKPGGIKEEQSYIDILLKMVERGIKQRLRTRRAGGNNRALTLKEQFSSDEFRAIVDERIPLVKEMISIRKKYGKDQWRKKLAESRLFLELSATTDANALNQLQDLIEERLHSKFKERNLKRDVAFACDLTAYELDLRSDSGEFYRTRTLLDHYDGKTKKSK